MEKNEFLEQHVFTGLKNLKEGSDEETTHQFSEADFETVLERAAHFGMGVYTIECWFNGSSYAASGHEDFRKKATDPKWYKKAFLTLKTGQAGLTYAGTYKVSPKLLARDSFKEEEEE